LVYFQDDTFIVNKKWYTDVTNRIAKLDKPYHCHIRCDHFTEEDAKQLKETGCKSVTFSIESGNSLIREKLLNRKMTDFQIINTANLLHKYGIKFRIENMVGLPFTTIEDDYMTLTLNRKL